jgi:hypothetical protein
MKKEHKLLLFFLFMKTLHDIYRDTNINSPSLRALDVAILNYFHSGNINFNDLNLADVFPYSVANDSPSEYLAKIEDVLIVAICSCTIASDQIELQDLKHILQRVEDHHWWNQIPLSQAMTKFCRLLFGLEFTGLEPRQLASGAAVLQWNNYCPWGNIPHPRHLALQGTLWAIFGFQNNSEELLSAAKQLGNWHLNTLDYNFRPFMSLFASEGEACYHTQLSYNYLFYRTLALVTNDSSWDYIASKQLEYLSEKHTAPSSFSLLPLVLSPWLEKQYSLDIEVSNYNLKQMICDLNTSLVGYRCKDYSLACTLSGHNTGIGSLHINNKVGIVNFGPQTPPLKGALSFGLNKPSITTGNLLPKIAVDSKKQTFSLKNTVGLMNTKNQVWMDTTLKFTPRSFDIEASFLGMKKDNAQAFIFYIKTPIFELPSGEVLKPYSLDRYEGRSQNIKIENEGVILNLSSSNEFSKMEVIPLAGGDNYWGADFLLAYYLSPSSSSYRWNINLSPIYTDL